MNKLLEIINEKKFENDKLYLIEKPSDEFGFFYQNGIVYFAKESSPSISNHSVDTSYLDMNLGVYITSEDENSSFKTGNYDMLAFKSDLNSLEFDVFYNICKAYVEDSSEYDFAEFFSSLVELFNKSKEGNKFNLIGLCGELLFIRKLYEEYEINVSNNWHLVGSKSKFDFSFPEFNLEVKTSTKNEMTFLLKHDQIFNNQKNYIAIVSLIETGEGYNIDSLNEYFKNTYPFSNNVKFQIALQSELLKLTDKRDKKRFFVLDEMEVFECDKMNTIQNIPNCITNIKYDYNFGDLESVDIEELFNGELE